MTRVFYILLFLLSSHLCVMAKTVSIDSLPVLYARYGNVFSVFDNYTFTYTTSDIQRNYSNRKIKGVLMKLFDRKEYLKARGRVTNENSMERALMDTAYSMQPLYDYMAAENLLCSFKWPEVYNKVYDLWTSDGKSVSSHWFGVLLGFHDPDARLMMDNYLKSIDKKGSVISHPMHDFIRDAIHSNYGSYSEDVKIRLINKDFIVLADFDYQPVNVAIIGYMENDFEGNCNPNAGHYLTDVKDRILKLCSDMEIYSYKKYQEVSREVKRNSSSAKNWYLCNKAKLEKEEVFWKSKLKYRADN